MAGSDNIMERSIDVTAAVIVREGGVLIVRRGPGERHAGFWEFPGGKIRPGETPQTCLERELEEELGVRASAGEIFAVSEHRYDHGTVRLIAIVTGIEDGAMTLSVHDEARWVPVERLDSFELLPADLPIAAKLKTMANGE